jgi:hypothetical protein
VTRLDNISTIQPAGDEPGGKEPGSAMRAPALLRRIRPTLVALAIVFVGALWVACTPINDLDSYWHVEIGREIVSRHTLDGLGRQWLGADLPSWRTSQWGSEIGMYLAVDRFGWLVLPALRLLTTCALFAIYCVTLVRRRHPVASFVVVFLLVVGLEGLLQDRPQTISLLFIALLAAVCERLWTVGRRPPPLLVAAACLLWAQLHGLWVLAPAAFLLVALGGVLERERRRSGQVSGALVCALASCAGLVNPQGPVSFLLPLRFRSSAESSINEWAATTFTMPLTIAWGLLLVVLVLSWVRSSRRVPVTELLWIFAWTAFGLMALRNVGPAALFTAPVAVRALEASNGKGFGAVAFPSHREARLLAGLLGAVAVGAAIVVPSGLSAVDALHNAPALAIARRLAGVERPLRVWNGYNVSGSLIAFGGGRDGHLRLVIDGRSDLWSPGYIRTVDDAQRLVGDWHRTFDDFRADAVVLPPDTPLVVYLQQVERWRVEQKDGDYVLLVPPHSTL